MRRLLLLVLSFTIVFLFTIGCSKPKEIRQEIWDTSKELVVDIDKSMKEEKQVDRYTYRKIESLFDKVRNKENFDLTKEEYDLIVAVYQLSIAQNSLAIVEDKTIRKSNQKQYDELYLKLSTLLDL